MKISTILWALWVLVLLAVLLLPIGNVVPEVGGFRHWDKIAHLGLFAVTGFMSVYGATFLSGFKHRFIFGLIFGLVLAVGTEFGQSFVATRSTSLYDLLADVLGLSLGMLFYVLLYRHEGIRSRFKL